jgi:hypothetical protein
MFFLHVFLVLQQFYNTRYSCYSVFINPDIKIGCVYFKHAKKHDEKYLRHICVFYKHAIIHFDYFNTRCETGSVYTCYC